MQCLFTYQIGDLTSASTFPRIIRQLDHTRRFHDMPGKLEGYLQENESLLSGGKGRMQRCNGEKCTTYCRELVVSGAESDF